MGIQTIDGKRVICCDKQGCKQTIDCGPDITKRSVGWEKVGSTSPGSSVFYYCPQHSFRDY
jgi:hypothetical protein